MVSATRRNLGKGGNVDEVFEDDDSPKTLTEEGKIITLADRVKELPMVKNEPEFVDPRYVDADDMKASIQLTGTQLKSLWDNKVINGRDYAVFAMLHDRTTGHKFDLSNFIWRWRGEVKNKEGDVKELDTKTVMDAVNALKKAELIEKVTERVVIQFEFNFDAFQ